MLALMMFTWFSLVMVHHNNIEQCKSSLKSAGKHSFYIELVFGVHYTHNYKIPYYRVKI